MSAITYVSSPSGQDFGNRVIWAIQIMNIHIKGISGPDQILLWIQPHVIIDKCS